MRPSKVKAKLKRGEAVLLTTLHLIDPTMYEMTSLMGFDGIWMDMEHHGYGLETALDLMRAARVGASDILCRCAKGEFMRMGRMLEAGAQGIMYPRCENAAEAKEVVRWSKFAPLGQRGFDGGNADAPYCFIDDMVKYVKQANDETFLVVQIEDEGAVNNAEAIAAVEGVDVLFFGPSDFTVLGGIPGQFDHPRVQEAIRHIADAAKKTGKNWGMPGSLETIQKLMGMGGRFFASGADIIFIKSGLEDLQKRAAALRFTFDRRL